MDDQEYWKQFYLTHTGDKQPSNFCCFIMGFFKDEDDIKILDAGCGNGRDSYYMASKFNVVGVDSSNYRPDDREHCKFYTDDFCSFNKDKFDVIYSRFTFHSISNEDHVRFLDSIQRPDTYLCIETRSDKGKDSYRVHGDSHYRNFTNLDYIVGLLYSKEFKILYLDEQDNVAIYKDENPICIRIICKKI